MEANITLDGMIPGNVIRGTIVVNSNGQIAFVDALAARLLQLKAQPLVSSDALPAVVSSFIKRCLEASDTITTTDVVIHSAQGLSQDLHLEATTLALDSESKALLVSVNIQQAPGATESKVHHFERLARIGMLSAGLAHELRNALVAVCAMTDVLIEQHQDNELAKTVRRELSRANDLAVRMLKYARPSPQSRKPVSTHELLDRALNLAESRFKETGATVNKSLQADPDLITADEPHMEQVFLNLLINAADSIEDNGQVELSTDIVEANAVGRAVRVAVKDNGIGIPSEILPNLFQPFVTTKRHGTGLGLYLARQIVHDHAGIIDVNSTPGEGTCVQVYLPVYSA